METEIKANAKIEAHTETITYIKKKIKELESNNNEYGTTAYVINSNLIKHYHWLKKKLRVKIKKLEKWKNEVKS